MAAVERELKKKRNAKIKYRRPIDQARQKR